MKYGLIGKSLKHSFSGFIQPKLLNSDYLLFELDENEISDFFKKRDFSGINVTIPYKQTVIQYLDFIDENAKKIGAVNTIINKNGKLYGYNTDFSGLKALIEKNNVGLENKNVIILGSGGTSKTARAVCYSMGAQKVTCFSRKPKKDFEIYENISDYYADADVLINTTPCGMFPDIYESAVETENFKKLSAVFDVVYNPINTKLVYDAKKKGIVSEGGLYMLVFQALFSAMLFKDEEIDKKIGDMIYNDLLKEKQNIVLIGMPSSGKSVIGKILAEKTGKAFVDTDDCIFEKTGITPKNIILKNGEEYFRVIENEIIKEVSKKQSSVIATGGGAVLKEENIEMLKENGTIIFLNRNFDDLVITDSRPLSDSKEKLKELFDFRLPLYKKYADMEISFKDNLEGVAQSIKERL